MKGRWPTSICFIRSGISRSTAPVLQALTLDEILSLHPTDAPIHQQVWCCSDVINFARRKQLLWQPSEQLPQLFRRRGTERQGHGKRSTEDESRSNLNPMPMNKPMKNGRSSSAILGKYQEAPQPYIIQ